MLKQISCHALCQMCIRDSPQTAYDYTAKGNLVAVISNGTAVLGLGDIGALSGKPVMEGKGLLFKIYAGIDVFDIEVNEKDPEKFIQAVKAIAPIFHTIGVMLNPNRCIMSLQRASLVLANLENAPSSF